MHACGVCNWRPVYVFGSRLHVCRCQVMEVQAVLVGVLSSVSMLANVYAFRVFVHPVALPRHACRESATPQRIRDRHRKMLMLNHPDTGGSTFIASKLNEAKDVLLKGRPS